jgi:hypothetical protein
MAVGRIVPLLEAFLLLADLGALVLIPLVQLLVLNLLGVVAVCRTKV